MRPATRRPSRLVLALVAAVLAVAGCSSSGGGGDSAGGDSDSGSFAEREVPREVSDHSASLDRGLSNLESQAEMSYAARRPDTDDTARKLIAKGNVTLRSDDVEQAAFDTQAVADGYGGEVTERETTTNDEGEMKTARLLLRIPVDDFTEALADLEEVADLQSSSSGAEDVTTKVIDTQVRIRAQRRSLRRVEALLDRAQSISDIIRIEGQLTRRQADLDSLTQRLDYLTNQTSMSTITVNISLPPKERKEKKTEPEETGFLAGLDDGWHALKSFGTDLATLSGQVLPFAVVLLVVGAPLLLLVRRLRRRDTTTPAAAGAAD